MSETPEQPAPQPDPGVGAGFSPHTNETAQPSVGAGFSPHTDVPPSLLARAEARAQTGWKSALARHFTGPACAWTILCLAIALYCAAVGAYVVLDHNSYRTGAFDLGIFDQSLWLVSHGHNPFVTVRGLHRFGDHVEFILYALAPAYWVWDDVRCALLLQTLVIALGALPVFLLARKRLGHAVALGFALAYLISPSVLNVNIDHVHAEAFGSTALIFAYYFASERRFPLMFILCGAAMLCKEDVAITTGALGLLVAWRWNRKAGLALLGVSIVWFILCMKLFLPLFNGSGFFRTSAGWFAGWSAHKWDPAWYWNAFVHDPNPQHRLHWPAAAYLLQLLGPLAFLSLLSPATALVAFPAIAINLLTTTDYMRSLDYHYMTSITPFLFAAAVEGAALISARSRHLFAIPFLRLRRRGRVVLLSPGARLVGPVLPVWALRAAIIVLLLGAAYWGNAKWSKLPLKRIPAKLREVAIRSSTEPSVLAINAAIRLIPADAALSADYLILPHVAHRKSIYMFPNPFSPESWGIRDDNTHDPNAIQYILVQDGLLNAAKRRMIAGLVKNGQFQEEYSSSGVRLYKRVAAAQEPVIARPASGNGLVGVFYSFDVPVATIPDWRRSEPVFQSLFPTIDFPPTDGDLASATGTQTGVRRRFLAVFDGFLMAPEPGEYEFIVFSDDGFRLTVAGRQISECNKLHAFGDTRGTTRLRAGLTPIQLLYFDNEPPHGLRLEWRRPGKAEMQVVPAEFLFPTREAAHGKFRE